MLTRRTLLLSSLTLAALVAASCGGDGDATEASSTTADGSATTLDATTTSVAPSTTEATATTATSTTTTTATTVAPTSSASTTTLAPAGPPTLRSNGIGVHTFGGPTPEVLLGDLTVVLGAPTSVVSADYPVDAGGFYENPADESGFAHPSGRTACFSNELCVHFGGADPSSLRFVGYRQGEGAGSLTTASGVTAGSAGSTFAASIIVSPGGCFSTGSGTADGVGLFLESTGDPFGYYDDTTDTYVVQAPPVADVVVLSVFAGDEPFYLYDDC